MFQAAPNYSLAARNPRRAVRFDSLSRQDRRRGRPPIAASAGEGYMRQELPPDPIRPPIPPEMPPMPPQPGGPTFPEPNNPPGVPAEPEERPLA